MMQASQLADPKALLVLGLGTLQPNILGHDFVSHIPTGRDEVATGPQVPTPERLAQPSAIHEEMMGRLPLDRLHHAARSQIWGHAQQQVHMIGTHVPAQDFD